MTAKPIEEGATIACFRSADYPCSYLPARQATTVFIDPEIVPDAHLYARLAGAGFRRSGTHFYRPRCTSCSACVPLRLDVPRFVPDRSQKRTRRRNADLDTRLLRESDVDRHFDLYTRYLQERHTASSMAEHTPEEFVSFLTAPGTETLFVEFLDRGRLMAVAVVDVLSDGLSAIYTFFDPGASKRALGVNAVLWQIDEARRRGLRWLYLGYWIAECGNMSYKNRFRPCQVLSEGRWKECGEANS